MPPRRSARLAEVAEAMANLSVSESLKEQAPTGKPAKPATTRRKPKPVENSVHCVQCHKSYKPSQNQAFSCQIEHNFDNQENTHENGGYRHTLPCCGLNIWDDNDDGPHEEWEPEMCFIGPHSTEHNYDEDGERIVYTGAKGRGHCSQCDMDDEDDLEGSDAEDVGAKGASNAKGER
ncbi:hypothetical protein B0H12DRAFT_1330280 [Mycena haematopus]|nr:hypothetical protein B0H12DRAFT_1330280 [Mycena haematopus]